VEYLAQVQRGIDYIEANLEDAIEPQRVARAAGISQWHFQRIFRALTNETLKTYIRSRRFSQSMTRLSETRERILEIALAAGFETQESFTRAFKRTFGVTPAHYRKHPGSIVVLPKLRFDVDYLNHLQLGVSSEPQIVDQMELQLVGMRTTFYSVDSEKNNLADKLPKLWAEFLPRLDDVPTRIKLGGYGVIRQTPARTDELEYWAAAPVTRVIGSLPKGLLSLRVPAARYARFAHRGQISAINMTVNYIYSSWLLRSDMRHTYGCDLEFYGDEYIPDSDQSVIYYSIPVE
jgi:AraC family transcriptional regulator